MPGDSDCEPMTRNGPDELKFELVNEKRQLFTPNPSIPLDLCFTSWKRDEVINIWLNFPYDCRAHLRKYEEEDAESISSFLFLPKETYH